MKTKDNADPETTTPNGCTCLPDSGFCAPTIDADNFLYDWCYTADECGEYNILWGWWDKCLYLDSSKPDYLALDWRIKQDQLWSQITADDSIGEYSLPTIVLTESVQTTFDDEWDVMPAGREKAIHAVGAVCSFVVEIADSPYTGLFKAGKTHGLIRMASGNDFTSILPPYGMTPGCSFKFLRTGRTSANFVVLHDGNPTPNGNHNFFATSLSNHLPAMIDHPGPGKFCQGTNCPERIGISDVCKYDQDGNEAEELVFPFKVTFEPADVSLPEEPPESLVAFVKQFDTIAVGTSLYTLKAHADPDDVEGHVLGKVVTTSKCVSSNFGDNGLFFQHQRIEEDRAARPDWGDAFDAYCNSKCFGS